VFVVVIPYIIGLFISGKFVPANLFVGTSTIELDEDISIDLSDTKKSLDFETGDDPFVGVKISLHRNGESTPCAGDYITGVELRDAILSAGKKKYKRTKYVKYEFESIVTTAIGLHLKAGSMCGPELPPPQIMGERARRAHGRGLNYSIEGATPFLSFCDMGEERTPELLDHQKLIPVTFGDGGRLTSLPCHYHTREGLRVSSLDQLEKIAQDIKQKASRNGSRDCAISEDGGQVCEEKPTELKLFAVPAGRIFMFAPTYVGEIFELYHLKEKYQRSIRLVTISTAPRVFDILNFFDPDEADDIVERALVETSETHRMKRSSTGATGYSVNTRRTSDNGFDTSGKTALTVKDRCMSTLGFDEYHESYTDGLQVLRYNISQAYIPHLDWIDDPGHVQEHDYSSSYKGTNRFATILLYMSNLDGEKPGGETVFPKVWHHNSLEEERISKSESLRLLRESGEVRFLKEGSWEEGMVADCRVKLSIQPYSSRAVLFYSQHPNGEEDKLSEHGACPVISGQKWAANLWVWNGPRAGYPKSPRNPHLKKKTEHEPQTQPGQIKAVFTNKGTNPTFAEADLYYEDMYWGDLSSGSNSLHVNTFEGHKWNIKRRSDEKQLHQVVIGKDEGKVMRFDV